MMGISGSVLYVGNINIGMQWVDTGGMFSWNISWIILNIANINMKRWNIYISYIIIYGIYSKHHISYSMKRICLTSTWINILLLSLFCCLICLIYKENVDNKAWVSQYRFMENLQIPRKWSING
jgi:hypothetical protein